MAVEIITREDLHFFRVQLLNEIKQFICQLKNDASNGTVEGYKTKHVRKILDCSNGKLQALRISGKLRGRSKIAWPGLVQKTDNDVIT